MTGFAAAPRLVRGEATFPAPRVGPAFLARSGAPRKGKADPAKRDARYRWRLAAKRLLPEQAVFRCGEYAAWEAGREAGGYVTLKLGAQGAHWSGIVTCKSVWHCPVCAAKIANGRREEVRHVIDAHQAAGGAVYMATFTIRHHAFQRAEHLRKGVSEAFSRVLTGRKWQELRGMAGIVGMIRALEVTHGANGWHPHLHVLILAKSAQAVEASALGDTLFRRWARVVKKMNFGQCSEDAWHFERCVSADAAGDYTAKWGPDFELTHGHVKDAKGGGRSPWRILRDYAERGERRDAELFKEYALAFKGARQLTWTNGLKEQFGLVDETDDELADREAPARAVAKVHEDVLRLLVKRGLAARALEAVEREGRDGLRRFMAQHGFDDAAWFIIELPPDPEPERADGVGILARIMGVSREFFADAS